MKAYFSKVAGILFFLTFALLQAGELPESFWSADDIEFNPHPKQIWVDTFSLESASEQVDKTGREYHLFKTELPVKLQSATIKSLMKVAASKTLWVHKLTPDLWVVKGNITFIGDNMIEQGLLRSMTKSLNNSLGIKRLRTEVFIYDTNISENQYALKFETGSAENNRTLNVEETAAFILKTLQSYLNSLKS